MANKKTKPGVMLYWDTFDILQKLSGDQVKQLLSWTRNYAQFGQEPPEDIQDPVLEIAWLSMLPKLKADSLRYEEVRRRNRINGFVRSFKYDYAPAHGMDPNDRQALEAYLTEAMETEAVARDCQPWKPDSDPETKTNSFSLSDPAPEGPGGKILSPADPLPSVEEVRRFCQEQKLQMNALGFVEYLGKSGAKNVRSGDWHTAARSWAEGTLQGDPFAKPRGSYDFRDFSKGGHSF